MTQEQRDALIERCAAVARNRREVSSLGASPYLGVAEALLKAGLIVTPEVEAAVEACKSSVFSQSYLGMLDADQRVRDAGRALLALEKPKVECSACGKTEMTGFNSRPWLIGDLARAGIDAPICEDCLRLFEVNRLTGRITRMLLAVAKK